MRHEAERLRLRISEQHRRFEARDQALVAVGGRVGEGVERLGVLDHAADEIEARSRTGRHSRCRRTAACRPSRSTCGCACPSRCPGLDRLGHEGRGLAIGLGDHVDDIFVDLHAVGGVDQRAEGQAELVLGGGDLVMVLVARQAHFEHGRDHLAADVHRAVDRRDREIAALGARPVAEVAALILAAGVGRQLDVVELEARGVVAVLEADVVEHEEFGLGADIDGVADAGRLEIGLGALGGRARVAGVELAGRRARRCRRTGSASASR